MPSNVKRYSAAGTWTTVADFDDMATDGDIAALDTRLDIVEMAVPIGSMMMFGGLAAPTQWMLCQGGLLSRTTYAALFTAISTRFNTGGEDGSNFRLPDMRGRVPVGVNAAGQPLSAGIGERYGSFNTPLNAHTHGGVDHLHGVSITSDYVNSNHNHYMNLGTILRHAPYATTNNVNVFDMRFADGYTIKVELVQTSGENPTGWINHNHQHGVYGNTGAADRTLTTGSAGSGDGTNGNIQPIVSFNYIIKAT